MCKLAVRNDPRIKVFEYEIEKKLQGETYHLVKQLLEEPFAKEQYDFSLILGQDNANIFHKWVNYQDLERMIRCVIVRRKGTLPDPTVDWYLKPPHIYLIGDGENPVIECKSTEIRQARREDRFSDVRDKIDSQVYDYIEKHNLYREQI